MRLLIVDCNNFFLDEFLFLLNLKWRFRTTQNFIDFCYTQSTLITEDFNGTSCSIQNSPGNESENTNASSIFLDCVPAVLFITRATFTRWEMSSYADCMVKYKLLLLNVLTRLDNWLGCVSLYLYISFSGTVEWFRTVLILPVSRRKSSMHHLKETHLRHDKAYLQPRSTL